MPEYELICCVVAKGNASKTMKVARKYGVKGGTISFGRGTVQNRLLDILGIIDVQKEIVTMIVERELATAVLQGLSSELEFERPHHGIAFSLSVSEFIGSKNQIIDNPEIKEVRDSMYNIVYVVVEKGNAEAVIEAGNKAGARGGTIVNARGSGIHEAQRLFSIEIEPEKEEVFIITKSEDKDAIVESIRTDLSIDEPGNGILFVIDVNEVYGLRD